VRIKTEQIKPILQVILQLYDGQSQDIKVGAYEAHTLGNIDKNIVWQSKFKLGVNFFTSFFQLATNEVGTTTSTGFFNLFCVFKQDKWVMGNLKTLKLVHTRHIH
jgi:hypothetical protein